MTNLGEWIAEEREAIGYKKGCEKTDESYYFTNA